MRQILLISDRDGSRITKIRDRSGKHTVPKKQRNRYERRTSKAVALHDEISAAA